MFPNGSALRGWSTSLYQTGLMSPAHPCRNRAIVPSLKLSSITWEAKPVRSAVFPPLGTPWMGWHAKL